MLLQALSDNGSFHNANFMGPVSNKTGFAYRGDFVLEGDFGLPSNERTPPKALLTQAVLFANDSQLLCVVGALAHLELVGTLLKTYKSQMSPSCKVLVYARDVPTPVVTSLDAVELTVLPFEDNLIWNELLDVLYIEKSDLKSLSPEDKVAAVHKALVSFKPKFPKLDWSEALARRVEKKQVERPGAI